VGKSTLLTCAEKLSGKLSEIAAIERAIQTRSQKAEANRRTIPAAAELYKDVLSGRVLSYRDAQ
jgi:hypothetical protein